MIVVAWLLVGWLAWTLGEYVLHRFGMHQMRGRGLMSREHLNHHAHRDSILEKWFLSWTGVVLVGLALGLVIHPGFGAGWVLGYGFYDLVHWRAHRRAPRSRYQRMVRRHHFHHHFGHPLVNHGVTWPVWDLVFGTYERPEVVRVPRRMAMVWLCDDDGEVLPDFAADYEVVGPGGLPPEVVAQDREDAFANRPPALA